MGDEPGGFWAEDAFKADDQKFFRETASAAEPSLIPFGDRVLTAAELTEFQDRWRAAYARASGLPLSEVSARWRLWRYADCKWWCRLPLLCKLARHVRSEVTDA